MIEIEIGDFKFDLCIGRFDSEDEERTQISGQNISILAFER